VLCVNISEMTECLNSVPYAPYSVLDTFGSVHPDTSTSHETASSSFCHQFLHKNLVNLFFCYIQVIAKKNKKSCCHREAVWCFVSVSS